MSAPGGKEAASRIVDAHFHLWNLDENYHPWLTDGDRPSLVKDYSSLRRNYLVGDFLRDIGSLNVVGAVHIQAEHDHRDPVRETRWLQRVADDPESRGIPQAIVADADFAKPDVHLVLEAHCCFSNLRGIRHAVHRRLDDAVPYDPLLDSTWLHNFRLLRRFNLSFDLQLLPRQATGGIDLISRNPDVQFVLTHAGMPFARDPEGVAEWRRSIWKYASFPNVAIKISGFGGYDRNWNARSIDPIVSEVVSAFTPRRCMLASNYPVERLAKPYAQIWHTYAEYFCSYSESERELLFWRNAATFYRLDL